MSSVVFDDPIVVAGGGIGGLMAAIALADSGLHVHVLERATEFIEAGAGIQLGPNATHILRRFGIWRELEGDIVCPEAIRIFDGASGNLLASVPLGEQALERYGAPYGVVHRADLQRALLAVARNSHNIEIRAGFELIDFEQEGSCVTAKSVQGETVAGAVLVGADGVNSRVRQRLGIRDNPKFCGRTAWRTLALPDARPAPTGLHDIGLWLGAKAHLVHYPVKGGAALNIIAVIEEPWDHEGWDTPGEAGTLNAHFANWCDGAQALIASQRDWHKWALAQMSSLERWGEGRVTLLGDAAHPILPFLAQGGAMAIEDAAALASALNRTGSAIASALQHYFAARAKRTARVQRRAWQMGHVYHLGGVARLARNTILQTRSPHQLLSDFDWLYRVAGDED